MNALPQSSRTQVATRLVAVVLLGLLVAAIASGQRTVALGLLAALAAGAGWRGYGLAGTMRAQAREADRAARVLTEERAAFTSLVEQMPTGFFRKHADGRFAYVNAAFARILGAPAAAIIGRTPEEVIARRLERSRAAEETRLGPQGSEHHALIMASGRQIEIEDVYHDEQGEPHYYHTIKCAVFGAEDRIVGTQGVLFDITQRKRADAELACERELLRTLLDSSPDSIYFKDRASRIVRVSQSEREHLRRVAVHRHAETGGELPAHLQSSEAFAEYVVGCTDADFYGPDRAVEFAQDEREIMATGRPVLGKVEATTHRDDGSTTWYMTSKMPWRDAHGDIIGIFGISRDITQLKLAELELNRTHQQLVVASRQAGMAEVATGVLHNVGNVLNSVNVSVTLLGERLGRSELPQLARVCELLRAHAPALGEFFDRDPRGQKVPGFLETLSAHLAAEQRELRQELEHLERNIAHIKEIVAMQQAYARVSGVVEDVSIEHLVEDAIRMNSGALDRHDIRLERDFQATPRCAVEKHKVLQILINLIRNAKYACDESGRRDKRIRLCIASDPGRFRISVADNGVGIPRENLTRIFSHGFTTRRDGHGFGLHSGAIAAREMGGTLQAHSDGPGCGATFTLELPLTAPAESPAPVEAALTP